VLRPREIEGGVVEVGHLERVAVPEGDAAAQACPGGEHSPGAAEILGEVQHLDSAVELAR
jgi:hypothetical protein